MDKAQSCDTPSSLELEVIKAKSGDRAALEFLIRAVQKDVSMLALRFLWHPQDAEEAAQEILTRVVTALGSFRGDSGFRTWVYRIACNTLISLREQRMEQRHLSFEEFGRDLADGLSDGSPTVESSAEQALLLEEVKIGCTLAMLLCLDRNHRLAYIFGEIMELDHNEALEILDIPRATYRKRLSRARADITSFMQARCGLVNSDNACRCRRRVSAAISLGRVAPSRLLFASATEQARRFPRVLEEIRQLEGVRRAAALYRSHPEPKPSGDFVAWLRKLIVERPEARVDGDHS